MVGARQGSSRQFANALPFFAFALPVSPSALKCVQRTTHEILAGTQGGLGHVVCKYHGRVVECPYCACMCPPVLLLCLGPGSPSCATCAG